jgi:hypothetical protein
MGCKIEMPPTTYQVDYANWISYAAINQQPIKVTTRDRARVRSEEHKGEVEKCKSEVNVAFMTLKRDYVGSRKGRAST